MLSERLFRQVFQTFPEHFTYNIHEKNIAELITYY